MTVGSDATKRIRTALTSLYKSTSKEVRHASFGGYCHDRGLPHRAKIERNCSTWSSCHWLVMNDLDWGMLGQEFRSFVSEELRPDSTARTLAANSRRPLPAPACPKFPFWCSDRCVHQQHSCNSLCLSTIHRSCAKAMSINVTKCLTVQARIAGAHSVMPFQRHVQLEDSPASAVHSTQLSREFDYECDRLVFRHVLLIQGQAQRHLLHSQDHLDESQKVGKQLQSHHFVLKVRRFPRATSAVGCNRLPVPPANMMSAHPL